MIPTEIVQALRKEADFWERAKVGRRGALLKDAAECIETLCAAIATPEVYAGVVTRVLEDERDRAIQELREAREIISRYPEAMGEIKP